MTMPSNSTSPISTILANTKIDLQTVPWANWYRLLRINRLSWSKIFTRKVRWWLAATIILVLLTVSLCISIPDMHAARLSDLN